MPPDKIIGYLYRMTKSGRTFILHIHLNDNAISLGSPTLLKADKLIDHMEFPVEIITPANVEEKLQSILNLMWAK